MLQISNILILFSNDLIVPHLGGKADIMQENVDRVENTSTKLQSRVKGAASSTKGTIVNTLHDKLQKRWAGAMRTSQTRCKKKLVGQLCRLRDNKAAPSYGVAEKLSARIYLTNAGGP